MLVNDGCKEDFFLWPSNQSAAAFVKTETAPGLFRIGEVD
jgi:hypothetical protein